MTYLAQLYFKIEINKQQKSDFDCQFRIINAENEEEAVFEARKLALSEETHFINEQGKIVRWKFLGITQIDLVDLSKNGAVLFSTTIERNEVKNLEAEIQLKNRDLLLSIGKKNLNFSR